MPTLNKLLDTNLSYNDILDLLEEETENFTADSGEVMFDDLYESKLAEQMLLNHYENVEQGELENVDSEGETSGYIVKFNGVFNNDIYDFPEEDNLEEN